MKIFLCRYVESIESLEFFVVVFLPLPFCMRDVLMKMDQKELKDPKVVIKVTVLFLFYSWLGYANHVFEMYLMRFKIIKI